MIPRKESSSGKRGFPPKAAKSVDVFTEGLGLARVWTCEKKFGMASASVLGMYLPVLASKTSGETAKLIKGCPTPEAEGVWAGIEGDAV